MAKKKQKVAGKINATEISKPPAISSIKYENGVFTVTWTRGENYTGNKAFQKYACYIETEQGPQQKTGLTKISASATSITKTIDLTQLYPNSGKSIARKFYFEMSGKNTGKLESPAVFAEFRINPPNKPSLTHTKPTAELPNTSTFSWEATGTSDRPVADVVLQSVRKQDAPKDIKGLAEWASASLSSRSLVDEQEYPETNIAGISVKRCVRVKARGMGGDSEWEYDDQIYSVPDSAVNVNTKVDVNDVNNTISITTDYNAPESDTHPITKSVNQYLIAVPAANQSVPSGASWEDATASADVSGINGATTVLDSIAIDLDEVLFVRVRTEYIHEKQSNYSPVQIKYRAKLKQPTNMSVSINQYNYRATITATNASDVEDSYLAVYYKDAKTKNEFICGYIARGQTSTTVQCMNWTGRTPVVFGVKAIQGATPVKNTDASYDVYGISKVNMQSDMQWQGGAVPVAPTSVSAVQSDDDGTILVSWKWAWAEADMAELSWATHADAWESTDEPDTYEVSNLNASNWRISKLTLGMKWYIRVRLAMHSGDDEVTYGPYCNAIEVDLSAKPMTPVLHLSQQIIKPNASVTASWMYAGGDGTGQHEADIYEVTGSTYRKIGSVKTEQSMKIDSKAQGWGANTQHKLVMKVVSDSNRISDYSAPVILTIANPLTASITLGTGFQLVNGVYELKSLPATATITGAGNAGTSTLIIERAQPYSLELPDESNLNGYDGETIYLKRYAGQSAVTINRSDLIGRLDDTAPYRIVGVVEDSYGQSATASRNFTVNWTHQAIEPSGTAVLDEEQGIVRITPATLTGVATGDYINIYRLSADKPQLIYEGAEFGETYVDPYPTIGEYGGYRLAFFTANGDFITAGKAPAIVDIPVEYDVDYHLFDFKQTRIPLYYNASSSNEWSKNFKSTRYLGGRIVGDWTEGVNRTGSAEAVTITVIDDGVKEALRRMADFAGLCHVRTKDGSNIVANVNVTETSSYEKGGQVTEYQLSYEAVDNPFFDAMSEDAWEDLQ